MKDRRLYFLSVLLDYLTLARNHVNGNRQRVNTGAPLRENDGDNPTAAHLKDFKQEVPSFRFQGIANVCRKEERDEMEDT